MDKKIIEYITIAIAIILLIYASYFFIFYDYNENVTSLDNITLLVPSSSQYHVIGDTIEFKNPTYDFYNLNVSRLNSSDERITLLLNYISNMKKGSVEYLNESCYVLTVEYPDGHFQYHSMIIPIDSFDKDKLSFIKESPVWLFEANNKEFVVDSAFNSKVVL